MNSRLDPIPFVDLHAQYVGHRQEFDAAIKACVERSSFIGGPDHEIFRSKFAKWCGDGSVALVGNGTDALTLTLLEVLGPGDGTEDVLTVSHTFIATSEAIKQAGYRAIFVDIDPDTYLLDLDALESAITPKTRAVIPVHIYGQMLDVARLKRIADKHGLKVIEDAAQAHGASYDAIRPGGAVFSRNEDLIRRIEMRANHGRLEKYLHQFEGLNSRLDGLQAAVLAVKLRHIDRWNDARRKVASWYGELLGACNAVKTPSTDPKAEHVFHLYVIEVENRDEIKDRLAQAGIAAGIHYPVPLHMQPALAYLGYDADDLPVTKKASARVLSLPIYPEITRAQVERVAGAVIEAVGR